MLSVVTLLTFANSWPDSLIFDDKVFIGPERVVKLDSFGEAFTQDIWNNTDTATGLYRPLLQIYFEAANWLFGSWLEGYHLFNIFLHLAATLLLFGFLRFLVTRSDARSEHADLIALLPALIFAVHPAHTEVVNSIFNGSSIFVSIFAISSLWWLLSRLESRPVQAWLGMGLLYTLAICVKESALVLPGIAVAMILLLTGGDLMTRMRRTLPVFLLLIPIIVYFWARGYALAADQAEKVLGEAVVAGITPMLMGLIQTIGENWVTKIAIFGQGIKVLAWPYPLQIYYGGVTDVSAAFYILLQVALLTWALVMLRRGKAGMAAGLAFYYIALAPSIRIVGLEGNMPHLQERYLYFPSIGLAMVLGVACRYLFERFGRKKVALLSLPVIVLLAALCWERNSQWSSELNLFETEYYQGHRGYHTVRLMVSSYHKQGNARRVAQICDENSEYFERSIKIAKTCAANYVVLKRPEDAIAALETTGKDEELWIQARTSLATIYVALREMQKAADLYVEIVNGVEAPEEKEMYKGDLHVTIYGKNREKLLVARKHYQNALEIRPGWKPAEQRLTVLDKLLADMEAATERESPAVDPRMDPE